MQLLRNKSTRSLWDPNYVDQTWINDKVKLIPRLRNWVDTYYYPGTPIGITEYNWGAESHINGATTQADILGIFGREGLDMAARWTTPDPSTPTYKAIKMYRNYDGNKSDVRRHQRLGHRCRIRTTSSASPRCASADGAMTVMVINKYLTGSTPVTLNLANFTRQRHGAGVSADCRRTRSPAWPTTRLTRAARLTATVPQQSITSICFAVPGRRTSRRRR